MEGINNKMSGQDFLNTYGPIDRIQFTYNETEKLLRAFFHVQSLFGYISMDALRMLLKEIEDHNIFWQSGLPISDAITEHLDFADISYYDDNNQLQTCPTLMAKCKLNQDEKYPDIICEKKTFEFWQDRVNESIKIEAESRLFPKRRDECGGIQWEEEVIDYDFYDYETGESMKVVSLLGKCSNYGCYYLVAPNYKGHNGRVYVPIHKYSFIDHFEDAYARVNIEDKTTGKKKWGIINWYGKEIVPVIYDEIWKFYGKNIQNVKLVRNGKVMWFNRKNELISSNFPTIERDYEIGCSDRDYFYAMTDGTWGDYDDFYGIEYYDE